MIIVNKVKLSVANRYFYPYLQKHYQNTSCGKILASYRNQYKGKRCFLIGNGPSLKAEDLDVLYKSNEITFGFNRVYNIFDQTKWRPSFYISQDEKMLMGCKDVVDELELPVKLIPIQLKWYYGINVSNAIYFNMNWLQAENPMDFLFSDDISKQLYCASTGMYSAAQLAAYMGFSEIYFIGVDHHFRTSMNNNGEIVVDESVKDYFSEKYNEDKQDLYIPNTEKSTLTYIAMKKHCDKRNIKVFNATRGGRLEVFPRVDFDELFDTRI